MSGIHRTESCLAQRIRFNHLFDTIFLAETERIVRLEICLFICLRNANTLV